MASLRKEGLSLETLQLLATGQEPADAYVCELLATLESEDEEVRAWASDALQTVEQPAPQLADTLAGLCSSGQTPPVASWACKLLSKLDAAAEQHQSALVDVLEKHPEITVRQQAAIALSTVSKWTSAAAEALQRAASSSDPRLQRLATAALAARR
ncbi:MAG: HEAT repeat domain-containing protein [Planctomycetales bacterium]|nr:HEAT repeat domain-containing protein [Planctomycetales bacterium]